MQQGDYLPKIRSSAIVIEEPSSPSLFRMASLPASSSEVLMFVVCRASAPCYRGAKEGGRSVEFNDEVKRDERGEEGWLAGWLTRLLRCC